jgi:hypothetical protein
MHQPYSGKLCLISPSADFAAEYHLIGQLGTFPYAVLYRLIVELPSLKDNPDHHATSVRIGLLPKI